MKRILAFFLLLSVLAGGVSAADPAVNVLIDAIRNRKPDNVSAMLIANPKLAGETDALGASVVHYAAACGEQRILRSVLAANPNVNAVDRAGQTPIFRACERSFRDNMTLLIAHKAEVNVSDTAGMTPLLIVCSKGKPEMAQDLLAAGAKVDAVNKSGVGVLMLAASKGNDKLTKILLAAGAKVEAVDNEGNTALHYAARNDQRDIIKLLPMLINVKNKAGQTPLNIAGIAGHTKFVQELLKYGAAAQ